MLGNAVGNTQGSALPPSALSFQEGGEGGSSVRVDVQVGCGEATTVNAATSVVEVGGDLSFRVSSPPSTSGLPGAGGSWC